MSFESKSVTGDAAPTSTLGAGETRQISPINEQNGGVPSLISYPARPLQGGKLDRAPKEISCGSNPAPDLPALF
jgi:hypothetical protein